MIWDIGKPSRAAVGARREGAIGQSVRGAWYIGVVRKMVGLGGLVVVLLLAAVIGWLVARGGSTTETSGGDEAVAPPTSSPRVAERGGAAVEGSAVGSEDPLADARRAERNALRQRILDAQRARARAAHPSWARRAMVTAMTTTEARPRGA